MLIKNTAVRFGLAAIIFHWILALLIIGMLGVGLYMVDLPRSLTKLKLYGWHKECGILILMLASLRLIWRSINTIPLLALPWWEALAAKAMHWLLYALMIAMPLSGWLMTSAAHLPISFFGWFILPNLIEPSSSLLTLFKNIHAYLAYGFITAIVLHTLAALKHHFIDRDDTLRRILP